MATIKINGDDCRADEGERLLAVLEKNGVRVPHLCFHHALTPAAACKLCVVEVKEKDKPIRTRLSCAVKVTDGLEVTTESAMVHQMRNTAMGNLLKLAPHSEAIHKIGREYGLSTGIIPDGCIRCRLCIRVCSEIIGAKALKMTKREGRNFVAPSENNECIGCLTCTNVCPTGAIHSEDEGNVRTILIRDEVVGRHTLERCQICGKLYATTSFLEHVKHSEDGHPDEKTVHHHCPTCTKLYYRKNMRLTQPKFGKK
ncbi:MAG: (2Fe-2S)-binding protein [Deltaproteobacteria bacterium]|nr:(2Fe-2S)-binding protein [Deltaproteobacteria bacterium]